MKKIISLFLAFCIGISCFVLPAYADSNDDVIDYLNNYKGKKFPDLPDFSDSEGGYYMNGEFNNDDYRYIFFVQDDIYSNDGTYWLLVSKSPLNFYRGWFGPSYSNRLFLGTDADFNKTTPILVYIWQPLSPEDDYKENWVEEINSDYYYGFNFHPAFSWEPIGSYDMYPENLTKVDFLYSDTDILDLDGEIFFLHDNYNQFYEHATEHFGTALSEYTGNDTPDFGGIIGSALNGFSNWLSSFWQGAIDAIKSIPQKLINIWESIKGLADKIKTALSPLFDGIKNVLNDIWDSIKGLADKIKTALSPLFDGVKNVIRDVKEAVNGVLLLLVIF